MRRLAGRDVWTGLLFIAVGSIAAAIGRRYEIGDVQGMGPGWMPVHLGLVLAALGGAIAAAGVAFGSALPERAALLPVLAVAAAVIAFGLLVRPLGLVLAVAVASAAVARAVPGTGWRTTALVAAGVGLAAGLLFGVLLRLPLPLWPDLAALG
jgi:hypothetical protein